MLCCASQQNWPANVAMGQKPTELPWATARFMSALPPTATGSSNCRRGSLAGCVAECTARSEPKYGCIDESARSVANGCTALAVQPICTGNALSTAAPCLNRPLAAGLMIVGYLAHPRWRIWRTPPSSSCPFRIAILIKIKSTTAACSRMRSEN